MEEEKRKKTKKEKKSTKDEKKEKKKTRVGKKTKKEEKKEIHAEKKEEVTKESKKQPREQKQKERKNKRKKTLKDKILIFEIVALLIVVLVMIGYVCKKQFVGEEEEEVEKPISVRFACQYANPWLPVYETNEDDTLTEIGQKRNKVVHHFDYVDGKLQNNYIVDTYTYTTIEAYEQDKDLCQTMAFEVTKCEENAEELTRKVTAENIIYKEMESNSVTEEWVEEYVNELENTAFSCQSIELEQGEK